MGFHTDACSEVTLKVEPGARTSLDAETRKAIDEGFGHGSKANIAELKAVDGSQLFDLLASHSDCKKAFAAKIEEAARFEVLLRNATDAVYRSWNKGGGRLGSSGITAFSVGHLVSFHYNWDWA